MSLAHVPDQPSMRRDRPAGAGVSTAAVLDNRTGLPDAEIREAVMAQWTEIAGMQLASPTTFQSYATTGGSMLARQPFTTPGNVMDEIRLARQVADTDDDIRAAIGQMIATAYGEGMENQHEDEATLRLFNEMAGGKVMNLDMTLKEIYREYLISGQFTTVSLFHRRRLSFTPSGTEQKVNAQVAVPLIGVLPSEDVRILTTDLFGQGELAYEVTNQNMREWLDAFFDRATTPAKRDAMRRENPVIAALFTERVEVAFNDPDPMIQGKVLFKLNQRMCHRTTMPKGAAAYPRPILTSNFALLEAKRLLNIMDYALLQGGTNYIVVAKQGSDKLPAQQPEIDNLTDQVRQASRSGVLVGDHRIDIEIITPDLTELLNEKKRKLLGRKLAMALMRIPEQVTDDADVEAELEMATKTVTSDRRDIRRHVEGYIYSEIAERNPSAFKKGAPSLWHSKIILTGVKDFFDQLVKARDRGDIPRKWAVEALGFDYESGVAQRSREKANGDDDVMTPAAVPFDANDGGPPSDTPEGRPTGSSRNNGRPRSPDQNRDPAQRPRRLAPRRRGEPVRAIWDEAAAEVVRFGELTAAVLEEYPNHTIGRVSAIEREGIEQGESVQRGPVVVVPVNPAYEARDLRAFRLNDTVSMIVGQREDGAMVAKALAFRESQLDVSAAEEVALRWGFVTAIEEPEEVTGEVTTPQPNMVQAVMEAVGQVSREEWAVIGGAVAQAFARIQPQVTVVLPEEGETEFIRDENGAVIGKRPKPRVTQE